MAKRDCWTLQISACELSEGTGDENPVSSQSDLFLRGAQLLESLAMRAVKRGKFCASSLHEYRTCDERNRPNKDYIRIPYAVPATFEAKMSRYRARQMQQ